MPVTLAGEGSERLRRFHGHYGEDLLGLARLGDHVAARAAVHGWIDANPPRPGDAWHPYTTSTRAGNWVAAVTLLPELADRRVRESLWRQLLRLSRNVEDDVLGNHVIRNARALVLGGTAFGAENLVEQGLVILERELPQQVLSDGGHYERSPVYHLVVLRDLLEVDAAVGGACVRDAIERMRAFSSALARPDGAPALFNDGPLDLAPKLDLPEQPDGVQVFPETGYVTVRRGAVWLAFDCGPPSPPFLPAHAHADALSFQLWVDGRPLVVDPGMPTYEAGAERDRFRGTSAHSTVAVGGDQFELWGAFRSGRLPAVSLLEAGPIVLAAAVQYRGVRHTRHLELHESELTVEDVVEGSGRPRVRSSLPFAPGEPARGEALDPAGVRDEPRVVSESLYVREPAVARMQEVESALPVTLGWHLPLGAAATIAS